MIPELIALAALALTALAEWLHARRVRRVAAIAFGPGGQPRAWAGSAPFVRAVATTLLVWGLVTLFLLDPKVLKPKKRPEGGYRHLLANPSGQAARIGQSSEATRSRAIESACASSSAR